MSVNSIVNKIIGISDGGRNTAAEMRSVLNEMTTDFSGYTASEIPFTPYLTLTSGEVQGTIQELKDEVDNLIISGGTGATELNGLTDVTASATTLGDILISNGSVYTNRALLESDISNFGTYLTTSTDIYVSGATFNTSDGNLSLSRHFGSPIVINLDGRYLTSETDSQTLSFSASTGNLEISSGNLINLDGRYALTGDTGSSAASATTFNPYLTLSSTTVQNVVEELKDEVDLMGLAGGPGDYVSSGNFNTSNGEVTLTRLSGGTVIYDLDGRYALSGDTSTNTDDYVSGGTFNVGTGDLDLEMQSGSTVTVNLDGRYLTAETDSQTLSFSADTGDLEISNGNTVNLDNRYSLTGHTHASNNTDDYVSGATFNTSDGVLTLTRESGSTVTVDLDGRYSETGHTHSVDASGVTFNPYLTLSSTTVQNSIEELKDEVDFLSVSGSNATWGSIIGTLSDQTDLQTELDAKVNKFEDTIVSVGNYTTNGQDADTYKTVRMTGGTQFTLDLTGLTQGFQQLLLNNTGSDITLVSSDTLIGDNIPLLDGASAYYTLISATEWLISVGGSEVQASGVTFNPYLTLGSTDVQGAIVELKDESDLKTNLFEDTVISAGNYTTANQNADTDKTVRMTSGTTFTLDLSGLTQGFQQQLLNDTGGSIALVSSDTLIGDNIPLLDGAMAYYTLISATEWAISVGGDEIYASGVTFNPYLTLTSTDTQGAIEELKDEMGVLPSGTDDYVSGATFNITDGILTLTRQSGSTVTVDLDGRYALSGDTGSSAASATTFNPYLTLGSTDVQGSIEELKDEVDLISASGATGWGGILGTLSAQTDLQTELDTKVNKFEDTIVSAGNYDTNSQNTDTDKTVRMTSGTTVTLDLSGLTQGFQQQLLNDTGGSLSLVSSDALIGDNIPLLDGAMVYYQLISATEWVISIGGTDIYASGVTFNPYLTLTSTDVQASIEELKDEIDVDKTNKFEDTVISAGNYDTNGQNIDTDKTVRMTSGTTFTLDKTSLTQGFQQQLLNDTGSDITLVSSDTLIGDNIPLLDGAIAYYTLISATEWLISIGGTDIYASGVTFNPYLTLSSVDTQNVIEELKDEVDAKTNAKVNLFDDTIISAGNYTTNNKNTDTKKTVYMTSGSILTLDKTSLTEGFQQQLFNSTGSDVTISSSDTIEGANVALSEGGFVYYTLINATTWLISVGGVKQPTEVAIAVSDETTSLTTGTTKTTFRMPYAMTVTEVRASLTTAPSGSTLTVDINESGSSILSTLLTIDAEEKTSTTATTPSVISDGNLADDAEITIDIDAVGSSTAGAGLKILLKGTRV